jgi:predicted ATPase
LAFVALFRLAPKRSIIAFDEPEGQLHPTLVVRVAQFLESMSERQTILITTHSDRLLDALTAPEQSVVLCSLDERRQTRLVRPDAQALREWLVDYRGFGDLRAAGHDASVMTRDGSKA